MTESGTCWRKRWPGATRSTASSAAAGWRPCISAATSSQGGPWRSRSCTPSWPTALGAERFLREMGIAASLDHPLIVPLHDSGNVGEVLYYVMPYVEGESLYQRLERERRLPLDDALRITHDVAAALGYAHGRRVLHRDVKPDNILLADGRALVADFGLARAIGAADYRKLTETGIILGTALLHEPGAAPGGPLTSTSGRISTAWGACCSRC